MNDIENPIRFSIGQQKEIDINEILPEDKEVVKIKTAPSEGNVYVYCEEREPTMGDMKRVFNVFGEGFSSK
jgi:hypothetical protein